MRLNQYKCIFGVQAGKFYGFMLTNRGIEANQDKFQTIIDMRNPSSKKEVQELTGRLAALSRYLSRTGDRAIHFFAALRKLKKVKWTAACEEEFQGVKCFQSSPSILTRPEENVPFTLYMAVSDKAMSPVLVQEEEQGKKPIYFINEVLKGVDQRYHKIEKLELTLVTTA